MSLLVSAAIFPVNGMKTSTPLSIPDSARSIVKLFVFALVFLAMHSVNADETSERVAETVAAAELALEENDYQRASMLYRRAAEMSDDDEVARQATRIAYSYGFNEEALKAARRWSSLDPENEEALLYVAQLYLRTGEIRESRRSFEALLKRGEEPVDERLLALLPVLAREDEDYAYELMRQLARPYRDSASAHYAVAVMALQAGDTDTATERAEASIKLEPEWVKPKLLYARALLISGDQEGAIDYAARLVGDDPDPDPEARMELAIMLISAGRDDDALSQVNQILLEQPYRTDALRLMAIINFRQEHFDAAEADFRDLLETGQYRMDALYYLGRIADERDAYRDAIRYYSQVTSGNNAISAQSRVAGILLEEDEPEKALEHLDYFAKVNPNYAVDMLRARAQLLARLERFEEALALYDQIIDYRPLNEAAYLGRAEILLRMERLDDAIEQYRAAVKRWPESAMSLNALGYTLADRTTRYAEAARLIRKALDIEPESPAIIDSWGWVLYRQGKLEDALVHLQKAYDLFKDPEVAAHIAEVLFELDRDTEAKAVLLEAETRFGENDLLEGIRRRYLAETP